MLDSWGLPYYHRSAESAQFELWLADGSDGFGDCCRNFDGLWVVVFSDASASVANDSVLVLLLLLLLILLLFLGMFLQLRMNLVIVVATNVINVGVVVLMQFNLLSFCDMISL